MRDYKLISADSHILEPPGLWLDRVPEKFKGRAPRMISMEQGDAWIVEGVSDPLNFGLNQCGGLSPEHYSPWIRWEDVRPDVKEAPDRIAAQDKNGVDAEILYPTPRISNAIFWNNVDTEFHLACIRAYNDWLSEYCSHAPNRLTGVALMPNIGIEPALLEMDRTMRMPGLRSVGIGQYPAGGLAISPEDDGFWAACQEAAIPVNIHVGLARQAPADHRRLPTNFEGAFTAAYRFFQAPVIAGELIYNKVFDRFPDLKVVFAEVDCAWVPYLKEQMDDRIVRQNPKNRLQIKRRPGEYFERNMFYTIVIDSFGIRVRHEVGIDQIMWSNDYPHATCDWPDDWKTIERHFAGVPEDEKHKILAGTAAGLYGFNRRN